MSSDAIKELLEDLLEREEMMTDLYKKILNETKNDKIKDSINSIIRDEIKHARNARSMLKILAE